MFVDFHIESDHYFFWSLQNVMYFLLALGNYRYTNRITNISRRRILIAPSILYGFFYFTYCFFNLSFKNYTLHPCLTPLWIFASTCSSSIFTTATCSLYKLQIALLCLNFQLCVFKIFNVLFLRHRMLSLDLQWLSFPFELFVHH